MREYCECSGKIGVFLKHRGHAGKFVKPKDKKHTQCTKCQRALIDSKRNQTEEQNVT